MIIGDYFEGDNHAWVKSIQHEDYTNTPIFREASRIYCMAEQLLETRTDLGNLIKKSESIDHRTLQTVHDLIAAKFRKDHAGDFHPELFKTVDKDSIRRKWLNYYQDTIQELCQNPTFVKNVLQATIYNNPDKRGPEAENELYQMLKNLDF